MSEGVARAVMCGGRLSPRSGGEAVLRREPGEADAPPTLRAGDEAGVRVDVPLGRAAVAVHGAGSLRADRRIGIVDGVAPLAILIPGLGDGERARAVEAAVLEVLVGVRNRAG